MASTRDQKVLDDEIMTWVPPGGKWAAATRRLFKLDLEISSWNSRGGDGLFEIHPTEYRAGRFLYHMHTTQLT